MNPPAAILLGSSDPALLRRMSEADADMGRPLPMVALVKRLTAAGIAVTVVEDLEEAQAVAGLRDRPPRAAVAMDDSGMVTLGGAAPRKVTPVLIDLQACSSDDPEDLDTARRHIGDCRHAFRGQGPIAITAGAPPRLLLECFRAGATDVIDLTHEGTAHAKAAVQRACATEQYRRAETEVTREQRELLDELVRDLVRTERRTIDLEQRLEEPSSSNGASAEGPPAACLEERIYLERIRSRHEQLLARYLGLKSASHHGS